MLPKVAIVRIHNAVDDLFEKIRGRLLGPTVLDSNIAVGYRHELSLPGLYHSAAKEEGAPGSDSTLAAILAVADSYLQAQQARTKAAVVHDVQTFLADAQASGVKTDVETVLGGALAKTFETITKDVARVVDTESQNGRAFGALEGIVKINDQRGVDDPTIFFVVVRDKNCCVECKRLHMMPDEITPRLWKLSQAGHGYHKKGRESPCIGGLHPHCRCSMATLLPGFGFNAAGFVHYVGPNFDAYAAQQGQSLKKHMIDHESWFHGTSDQSGLLRGDTFDPRKGNFEPVVWASSDRKHAEYFAHARAALDNSAGPAVDAQPVVHGLRLSPGAQVLRVDDFPDNEEPDAFLHRLGKEGEYDAVRIENGENGAPTLAILQPGVATATAPDEPSAKPGQSLKTEIE